jgi:hypothetical protein
MPSTNSHTGSAGFGATGATAAAASATALAPSVVTSSTIPPQTWTSNPDQHYDGVIAVCPSKPSVLPCYDQPSGLELVLVPIAVGVAAYPRGWWPGRLGPPPGVPTDSEPKNDDASTEMEDS